MINHGKRCAARTLPLTVGSNLCEQFLPGLRRKIFFEMRHDVPQTTGMLCPRGLELHRRLQDTPILPIDGGERHGLVPRHQTVQVLAMARAMGKEHELVLGVEPDKGSEAVSLAQGCLPALHD